MLAYADLELKEIVTGKKSLGIARGALNSNEPDLLLESTNGRLQIN